VVVIADYRLYFDIKDLDDNLLTKYVKEPILKDTAYYVESFALTLGVTASNIALPTPYIVSRFAQLYAYMTTAQRMSTFSKGGSADNDSFALKYNMYRQLLKDCEARLTADSFTNGQSAKKRKFPLTMEVLRN
jgi:hypothetical protein